MENSKTVELGRAGKKSIAQLRQASPAWKKPHCACSRRCRRKTVLPLAAVRSRHTGSGMGGFSTDVIGIASAIDGI